MLKIVKMGGDSMKRISCRAIIIENDTMVSMYRELKDRIFYTFPGGGLEENETEEECVKREVLEEFGLNVEPVKKVYTYESERSIEHFYLCNVVGGEFGKGTGEEFHNNNNGVYKPTKIKRNKKLATYASRSSKSINIRL